MHILRFRSIDMRSTIFFILTLVAMTLADERGAHAEIINLKCESIYFRIDSVNKTAQAAAGKSALDYKDGAFQNAVMGRPPEGLDVNTKAHQFVKFERDEIRFGDENQKQLDFVLIHKPQTPSGPTYVFQTDTRSHDCFPADANEVTDHIAASSNYDPKRAAAAAAAAREEEAAEAEGTSVVEDHKIVAAAEAAEKREHDKYAGAMTKDDSSAPRPDHDHALAQIGRSLEGKGFVITNLKYENGYARGEDYLVIASWMKTYTTSLEDEASYDTANAQIGRDAGPTGQMLFKMARIASDSSAKAGESSNGQDKFKFVRTEKGWLLFD